MASTRGRVGNRLAGYDEYGEEIYDGDVLSRDELEADARAQVEAAGR